MMALLGPFTFRLDPTNRGAIEISGIDTTEDFRFATHKKINGFDTHQDVAQFAKKFTIKGDLVLKKVDAIDPIAYFAKLKLPIPFVIGTGEVWLVIVKSIKKGRSIMDRDGLHFRQSYTIQMEEVLDWIPI